MAHYAFLDENNIVTEVITGVDENVTQTDVDGTEVGGSTEAWETFYGNFRGKVCKRTSYNTVNGENKNGGEPFRHTFAWIGAFYNEELDKFKPRQYFNSWTFNEETYNWEAPTPKPEGSYFWNEENLNWDPLGI